MSVYIVKVNTRFDMFLCTAIDQHNKAIARLLEFGRLLSYTPRSRTREMVRLADRRLV